MSHINGFAKQEQIAQQKEGKCAKKVNMQSMYISADKNNRKYGIGCIICNVSLIDLIHFSFLKQTHFMILLRLKTPS